VVPGATRFTFQATASLVISTNFAFFSLIAARTFRARRVVSPECRHWLRVSLGDAAADVLPPSDLGAAQGVRFEAGKVEAGVLLVRAVRGSTMPPS
jgi:hypothetical protein